MADETTNLPTQVQASQIKQLRLIRTNERPDDAILQITTNQDIRNRPVSIAAMRG